MLQCCVGLVSKDDVIITVLKETDHRVIIAIVVIIMICCCCCCCYFIGKMVHQSSYENSTPVAMQTVRSVEITPSNRQFYVMKTIPFNQPSSNRPSILDAPLSSNHPSFPDAPSSNSHPSISDAPPKYSEIFPTPVKSPPSLETQL